MKKKIKNLLLGSLMLSSAIMPIFGLEKVNAEDNVIKVMLDSQPGENDPQVNALEKWSAETGNNFEILVVGYDEQESKLPMMIKNNDLPDMVVTTRLHKRYPEEFVNWEDVIDTSVFQKDVLTVGLGNVGGTFIVPTQVTITNYYYNKDAFEAAGITAPTIDNPWTLDELYENAQKLVDSGAVKYGFAVDYSRARYDNLMYSNGGSITETNEKGDVQITVNSPENIATLEKFVELNEKGVMPKNIWAGGSSDNPVNYFANGDVGIYLSGSFNYVTINNNAKMEFGVMPAPVGTKQASELNGGRGWGVFKNSPNSKLAQSFVEWFYSKEENYKEFLDLDFGLPYMTNYDYVPSGTFAPEDYEVYKAELEKVPAEFIADESTRWGILLTDEYRQSISQAVSGELSAKDALNRVAKTLSENSDWEMKYAE